MDGDFGIANNTHPTFDFPASLLKVVVMGMMKQEGATDAVQVSVGSESGDPGHNEHLPNSMIVFDTIIVICHLIQGYEKGVPGMCR